MIVFIKIYVSELNLYDYNLINIYQSKLSYIKPKSSQNSIYCVMKSI